MRQYANHSSTGLISYNQYTVTKMLDMASA
jgi:hypothetical protein